MKRCFLQNQDFISDLHVVTINIVWGLGTNNFSTAGLGFGVQPAQLLPQSVRHPVRGVRPGAPK